MVDLVNNFLFQQSHISKERRLNYLRSVFDYQGGYEIGEILDFLRTRLARGNLPKSLLE